ncbi:MAG: hypothetical protein Cons2KO_20670 [Congregibacter sp.]
MADLVQVPIERVPAESLYALLEEFATRDGTDYGAQETPLHERVAQLHRQLAAGKAQLLFDVSNESWDIVAADQVDALHGMLTEDLNSKGQSVEATFEMQPPSADD